MSLDVMQHPCFNADARGTCGRVHLPVAEKCNIQCNFCNRKYDCVNESRPGVTSAVLSPEQAVAYLDQVLAREPRITVAGVAGPGDPFADPLRTLQTLRLVRQRHPNLLLCVASNGLNVSPYVQQLADLGVSHFTITVNAVDPKVGGIVYAWVRAGRLTQRTVSGARTLLERQLDAIRQLKQHGITVKVNTIIIPGVNDEHVPEVARTVAAAGADVLNCIPLYPAADTPFADLAQPSAEQVASVRLRAEQYLPQMRHCTRCRSDAVGLLGQGRSSEFADCLSACASGPLHPGENRPYIAAASWEGMLVNQHLGEAAQFWIFQQTAGGFGLVATRTAPPAGSGGQRWLDLAELLRDCRAVLVSGVGQTPREVLASRGVRVIEMEGVIEEGLAAVYGGDVRRLPKPRASGCGAGCTGTGGGCG